MLKNKFVFLTQLSAQDPNKQRNKWKADLTTAAQETLAELCPRGNSDPEYNTLKSLITNEIPKNNRRHEWLTQKSQAWLISLTDEVHGSSWWFPHYAFQVAHELFLKPAGDFDTFVSKLGKQKQSEIQKLFQVCKSLNDLAIGTATTQPTSTSLSALSADQPLPEGVTAPVQSAVKKVADDEKLQLQTEVVPHR